MSDARKRWREVPSAVRAMLLNRLENLVDDLGASNAESDALLAAIAVLEEATEEEGGT